MCTTRLPLQSDHHPKELGATNERRRAEDAKSSSGIRLGSKLPVSFWLFVRAKISLGSRPVRRKARDTFSTSPGSLFPKNHHGRRPLNSGHHPSAAARVATCSQARQRRPDRADGRKRIPCRWRASLEIAPHVSQLDRLACEGPVVLFDHDRAHAERSPTKHHACSRRELLGTVDRKVCGTCWPATERSPYAWA
jgi:hypothetical protein